MENTFNKEFKTWVHPGEIWEERLEKILETLPSGSGLDAGPELLLEESHENKLVFSSDFHHLGEHGFYNGWSEHKVIVIPDFVSGYQIRITGRDRNMIKDYLYEVWQTWLCCTETPEQQRIKRAAGFLSSSLSPCGQARSEGITFAENNLRHLPEFEDLMSDWRRTRPKDPLSLDYWISVYTRYGTWPS